MDGAARILARWGPLRCGLFECGGRWGVAFRWLRIRPSGAPRALFLPDLPLRLCLALSFWALRSFLGISGYGHVLPVPLCQYCTAPVTRSRAQRERASVVCAGLGGAR